MRVLIVTGGSFREDVSGRYSCHSEYDAIIAADSGLGHCHQFGIEPTDILGDFDSLKERELLDIYKKKGIPVRTFPTRKDDTDTELAIKYALDLGATEIVLYGATGTRYDHALANISLLIPLEKQGVHGVIVDEHNMIEVLAAPGKRYYKKSETNKYFSILSMTPECKGITMRGFSYPLEDSVLKSCCSLGISNEITDEDAELSLKEGVLLIIQAND